MPHKMTRLQGLARRMVANVPPPLAGLLRSLKRAALNTRSSQKVFSEIAKRNGWDGTESISGPGSSMGATSLLREALPALLQKYDIRVLLDIPCGDAFWIGEVLPNQLNYIGADIVPDLIVRNQMEKSDLGTFEVLDLVYDVLPRTDLAMVRDCFIHLPNAQVKKAILNIKKSGTRYLLTTHFVGEFPNIDIEIGGYRPINLCKPPFSLPKPLALLNDFDGINDNGKHMALWKCEDI